jgi:hypothetical protein
MTLKGLSKIVKTEKIGNDDEIFAKVSIQNADGTWRTEIVPIESYYITKDGKFQLGCCAYHPDVVEED